MVKILFTSQDHDFKSVVFTDGINRFAPVCGITRNPESKDYWTVRLPDWCGAKYYKLTQCWTYLEANPGATEMEIELVSHPKTPKVVIANDLAAENALNTLDVFLRDVDDDAVAEALLVITEAVERKEKAALIARKAALEAQIAELAKMIGE